MKWILKNSEDDMITLKQNDDLFNLKGLCEIFSIGTDI